MDTVLGLEKSDKNKKKIYGLWVENFLEHKKKN